ncbi:MAG: ABC transporter permease [Planctomycetota bacterium]
MCSSLVNLLIAMPVVFVAVFVLGYVAPESDPEMLAKMAQAGDPGFRFGLPLVLFPVLLLLQAIWTTGLCLFFSAFNLFWRDTYHLMGVALTVWMFSTPIFYPAAQVQREGYGWLLEINPMHWLIESWRAVVLNGSWPDWRHLGLFALASVVVFALGAAFFQKQGKRFPDLL